MKYYILLFFTWAALTCLSAQQAGRGVHYTGKELSNPYFHDGQLSPAVGIHNIQLLRANRDSIFAPLQTTGWTYNHQPMMCHWNGRFYVHFLCDSTDEHIPPSRTMLMTSDRRLPVGSPCRSFPHLQGTRRDLPRPAAATGPRTCWPSCTSGWDSMSPPTAACSPRAITA